MTNPKHTQRLNAAYREWQRLLKGTPEHVLQLRLTALSNKGAGEIDPFIRALARRELDALRSRHAVSAAQAELATLRRIPDDTHFPGQPDRRALQAARKEELERTINYGLGQQLLLAQDPLMDARKEAIAAYEAQEATEARHREIVQRVAEKRAAMRDAELDAAANRVLAAERAKG
jgi:hypothetical protein